MKRQHISKNQIRLLMVTALLALLAVAAAAQESSYAPTVQWDYPNIDPVAATSTPGSVRVGFSGTDPDGPTGLPVYWRYLMRSAQALDGTVVKTRAQYEAYRDELVDFADPMWSGWISYREDSEERNILFPDLEDEGYYLLAIQAMDTLGAVSLTRDYGQQVFNFQANEGYFRPELVVAEMFLGQTMNDRTSEIAAGQPLNFSWAASADMYNGNIASYRHGFDLSDYNDPMDPGWAVAAGLAPENLYAVEQTFNAGVHLFTVRVEDDLGTVRLLHWTLTVVPMVPRPYQKELLFIDQVVDDNSNAWQGQGGSPAYDHEAFRNAYWQFLEGGEGVAFFDWSDDRRDHTEPVSFQELVQYKAVIINARSHAQQLLFNQFRPQNDLDLYVWLAPYQEMGGNVFLVGDRSMESFLEAKPNYAVPIMFENPSETYTLGGDAYIIGFGEREYPDESTEMRGPQMYPYATAGIASLDWSVPVGKYIYGSPNPAASERHSSCSGLKGMVLDAQFVSRHGLAPGALADTLFTDPAIDWRDTYVAGADTLGNIFTFTGDEFVDFNISANPMALNLQDCAEGPDGLCVEPMFQGLSRFDWLKQRRWSEGDADWPLSAYSAGRLEEICGDQGLDNINDPLLVTARVNNRTYGYLSYKTVADKPGGKADVYWGFDPYRFDHESGKEAVRWVLDYFGLNLNR